jgi:hypothetical protein
MKVLAHDRRLEGRARTGRDTGVIEVDERTTLGYFTNRFSTLYEANGRAVIEKLKIMAHGIAVCYGGTERGGYGIQFCRENIILDTVEHLRPLRGKVDKITLCSCSVAATSPDMMTVDGLLSGQGQELCSRIARITHTELVASTVTQQYTNGIDIGSSHIDQPIEFGEWEGPVLHFDRQGNLTRTTMRV